MAENKMTKEVLKAAKGTGSVEELQKLAKENGMELDAAQAEEMYARLHPVTQELSDDELDNVTGGDSCDVGYSCPKCGSTEASSREPLYGCTYVTCACCWVVQILLIPTSPKHRVIDFGWRDIFDGRRNNKKRAFR